MKIYEIGTGYTSIPAKMGAATEIVVEELTKSFLNGGKDVEIIDVKSSNREKNELPIVEVYVPNLFAGTDVQLGIMHKIKRVVYSINLAQKLIRIIKQNNEKVVLHFHNQYNLFFFLKMTSKNIRKKCYIAYTNHSYIWHGEWKNIYKTIKKKYFQEVYSMKNADAVFVLNEHTVQTLENYVGILPGKIKLIDNGVNTKIYHPKTIDKVQEFKKKQGFDGKQVFLQIGSVCDRKNQLGSIELLLPILKEKSDCVFLYAGGIISEEYQQQINDFVKKNGIQDKVKYLGELKPGKELNNYYNLSDALIFPSKSEGFSLVIIEAMAAGVPVIIDEKLQFKLSNECLKFNNQKEFEGIIRSQIMDKDAQKHLSEKVRNAVVMNYSWDKISQEYFEIWNQGEKHVK